MTTVWPPKHASAVGDYRYNIPLDTGDTVSTATLSILSGSVAIDSQSKDNTSLTAWLSAGVQGETAVFQVTWTTAGGRTDDDIITLAVISDPVAILAGVPGGDPNVSAFSYPAFIARYPEMKSIDPAYAQTLFAEAGIYLDNTAGSLVQDVATRGILLNMIVAHLAALGGALDGGTPSGMVGRVTSASEGTVKIEVDSGLEPGGAAWFAQTPYGFSFWQATKRYRMAQYRPARQPNFDPIRWTGWRR